ncbi:nucleotidyltransferase family protein [Shewanella sp. GXUN23E]|uniref:nucleotidyltransferase family protein n=1 Tax=Shewanella sp. GXUN23E TaxID=3422498 RepID=UPI003D7ED0CF
MDEVSARRQITHWLSQDIARMVMLQTVARVAAQTGDELWLAAGFVRNLVWDRLYRETALPLNDLDVIYFGQHNLLSQYDRQLELQLGAIAGELPWSVKNQARMHVRNGDRPYHSVLDAMSFWPERQTAVAVRLNANNELELISAFGFACLFDGGISHNIKRERQLFLQRIAGKGWLDTYPGLSVECM